MSSEAETIPPTFVLKGRDFWRTTGGRFDLILGADGETWIAIDWDHGRTTKGTQGHCESWCAMRAETYQGA